jgi:tetratricopeptide (TPR) repeat protein
MRPGQGGSGTQWDWANRPDRPWRPDRPDRPWHPNRPGWPGNRPGWAWNRPGWPGNRPGSGNIGSGNIGSGNIGQIGDNLNLSNTNTNISSWMGGDTVVYNSYYNNASSSNFFGGGWGGFTNPYVGFHNNWYQGSWGANYLGGWLAPSAGYADPYVSGFYGGYSPYGGYSYGIANYVPSWSWSNLLGWGLGTVANSWVSSSYVNPYYTAPTTVVVQNQPAAAPAPTYDYSQPINVAADPPEESATDTAMQVFQAARDSFKAGDYSRALTLTDQALQQQPNDPTLHEFRALALFALKRYDDAAAVAYAVLTAGPGWNWTTLVGLYPDADTYTNQLRALEAQVRSNPQAAPSQFLLGYHYLVQGNADAARNRFAKVVELQPQDQLSARFAKALTKPEPASADDAKPDEGPAPATAPPPGPPPAQLVGTWKARPAPETAITLDLTDQGAFTWDVAVKDQKETLTGEAEFRDDILTLARADGPPLAGKVEPGATAETFQLKLLGGPDAPTLTFTK